MADKFDFSDLTDDEAPTNSVKKFDFSDLSDDQDTQSAQDPETVDTFLGKMPRHMPEFEAGSPENKDLLENMIGGFIGSPGIKMVGQGVGSFARGIKSALTKIKPKELAYGVQKGHDVAEKEASGLYNLVKDQSKARNVKQIDIGEEAIDKAKSYLPKTDATKKLLEKARYGDYDALHDLQSDLWKHATRKASSPLAAEQNEAEEIFEQRDKLNNLIHSNLEESGHKDLSEALTKGRKLYRNMKETYYSHPGVAKLVERGQRLVPKNPMEMFSEESDPMRKLYAAHPEVERAVKTNEIAKKFMEGIGKYKKRGIGLGAAGGALYGYHQLADLLSNMGKGE